ncbi:IS66 family insertion sequence element accessory protein TnpB [Pseudoalteromonas sp. S16_S37]|uniref:IS66 family insertion sequence element accessory protein TnpB n=1 Tax=Pseudoalteromonas sp. S16_S37 TaxID=2720228 RepID=UPI0016804C7E|nr:IS66 family insertion sequence element accessory protein TnpB [Pseudoalteromonas sp. S16_S37]MBD1584897.1 IS66 family insertion sequence element accessory protein TnpB [Pseudoalteromonas sp. S16_S37]
MICWQNESVYLHRQPVDFRKSINGLAAVVEQEMATSAMTGNVFAFCNKSKDKLKVLYWDKTGFALWYKRLEKDKFKWPNKESDEVIVLTAEQWQWLLSGLSVIAHKPLNYGYNV